MLQKFALAVLLLFCTAAPITAQEQLDSVSVTILPYLSYAPFYIAEQEGYFAEQGIQIEYVPSAESQTIFPSLIRGELDAHIEFINAAMFNAIERGAAIQVVADKGFFAEGECAANAFIARNDVLDALQDPEQIIGLNWQYEMDTVEQYMLESAFEEIGADLSSISSNQPLPPHLFHDALLSEAMDVGFTGEPWITRAVETGEMSVWKMDNELSPNLEASMLIFGRRLLTDDPELGQRFMVGYLQGVRQYLEGKTERNIELVSEFTQADPALVEASCWATINPTGEIQVDTLMTFQAWLVERGLLDEIVPAEVFWNPAYVEYANEILGEYED